MYFYSLIKIVKAISSENFAVIPRWDTWYMDEIAPHFIHNVAGEYVGGWTKQDGIKIGKVKDLPSTFKKQYNNRHNDLITRHADGVLTRLP